MFEGVYGLVLHRLSELQELPDGRVVADRKNNLLVLKRRDEILVIQSIDRDFFEYLSAKSAEDPDFLAAFFEAAERARAIPSHLSLIRLSARDLERYRRLRRGGVPPGS